MSKRHKNSYINRFKPIIDKKLSDNSNNSNNSDRKIIKSKIVSISMEIGNYNPHIIEKLMKLYFFYFHFLKIKYFLNF